MSFSSIIWLSVCFFNHLALSLRIDSGLEIEIGVMVFHYSINHQPLAHPLLIFCGYIGKTDKQTKNTFGCTLFSSLRILWSISHHHRFLQVRISTCYFSLADHSINFACLISDRQVKPPVLSSSLFLYAILAFKFQAAIPTAYKNCIKAYYLN